MSPWNYVAIVMGVLLLCWVAGIFIAIAHSDDDQARQDAEDLLRKADTDVAYRPRLRAKTEPLHSLHRTHYEP